MMDERVFSGHPFPEQAFLCAILQQAKLDLRPKFSEDIREVSVRFFRNEQRWLECLCDAIGLDHRFVQERIAEEYPEVL